MNQNSSVFIYFHAQRDISLAKFPTEQLSKTLNVKFDLSVDLI